MAKRPLTFRDEKDHEQEWLPGDPRSAADAFEDFVGRHRGADNTSFTVEDGENGEKLVLRYGTGTICRVKDERTEYYLVTNRGDYWTHVANFGNGGLAALDFRGPWLPDEAGVDRARLRAEFDKSVLRRTHPRELRRRLEVLTRVDGREPVTVAGVTHYGFGNGGGDTVNAWCTATGRILVLTFDHTSELNYYEDPRAQAALYDGVPPDLLALVRDVPETDTTLNAEHPDGGTVVAATGVFSLAGPCAMAEGLVSHLPETGSGIADTGVGWLLETFLALEDFTPAAVAETTRWWSADAIEKGFAATAEPAREQAPLDPDAVERFCRIWADTGYNDRWDVHYVLFDSRTIEDTGEDRDELLRLVQTLGLERVDSPPGAADGEVWVRSDPRIDAELGNWA